MPSAAKPTAIALIVALLAASGGLGPAASAQQAAAPPQRCSGTLCDLYYGTSESDPPPRPQAAPTPLTVPHGGLLDRLFPGGQTAPPAPSGSAPPAAAGSLVNVQGGGLLGSATGAPEERCTGTLCDLYYGSSPPSKPPAAPAETTMATTTAVRAAPSTAAPEAVPTAPRKARTADVAQRQDKARCAAAGRDPWQCYR